LIDPKVSIDVILEGNKSRISPGQLHDGRHPLARRNLENQFMCSDHNASAAAHTNGAKVLVNTFVQ
jgi:hypothetical protein